MEIAVTIAIIVVLGSLSFFYPAAKVMLISNVAKILIDNEYKIVHATYSALPSSVRKLVDSKTFSEIVANVLRFGIKAVEKDLTKK